MYDRGLFHPFVFGESLDLYTSNHLGPLNQATSEGMVKFVASTEHRLSMVDSLLFIKLIQDYLQPS